MSSHDEIGSVLKSMLGHGVVRSAVFVQNDFVMVKQGRPGYDAHTAPRQM